MAAFPARRAACASVTLRRKPRSAGRWRSCQNGDRIRIDGVARRIDLLIDDAEMARRKAAWTAPAPRHPAGLLAKYAALVGQADKGAVTHAGNVEWPEV